MSSMFFGQYLLEKGVIDRDALLDAIERQRTVNRPLTTIAVAQGLMEQTLAAHIDTVFRLSNRTLAEICTTEGGLSATEVQRLVDLQTRTRLLIGDALVAGGHLTAEQVEENHRAFRAREEKEEQTLEADFEHLEETAIIRTCTELTLSHVSRVAGMPVKLSEVGPGEGGLVEDRIRLAQGIIGDRRMIIAVDLPEGLVMKVARGMLGAEAPVAPEAALDAACELVNIIGGNACTRLEAIGHRLRPEPPYWLRKAAPKRSAAVSVCAKAMAGNDDFELNLFLE